jgi:hypothetical protein
MATHYLLKKIIVFVQKGTNDFIALIRLRAHKFTNFGGILTTLTNISELGYISLSN